MKKSISKYQINISYTSLLALFWAVIGLALATIYSSNEWQATFGILMVSQAFSGRIIFFRLKALRHAIFPDFLTTILLMQFGAKTLTSLGILIKFTGSYSNNISSTLLVLSNVEMKHQFQAELIFLLSTVIFTAVWIWQEGKNSTAIWTAPPSKTVWRAYSISLLGTFTISISSIGSELGSINQLLHIFSIGSIAVLLSSKSAYALGNPKSIWAIIGLVPLLIIALGSGMKSEIALVFFPIMLPIILKVTPNRIAFLIAFFIFTVLFIFPFSTEWREANWNVSSQSQQEGLTDVAGKVVNLWEREGFIETGISSTAKWLSRGSSSEQGGLVMEMAEQDGFIGPVLIEGLTTIFVPRFLWPDKPTYAPGAWFTWYLGLADSPTSATSATAMMLPTELYWMFGIMGVILGMSLIAILNYKVWQFFLVQSKLGIVPILAMFNLLVNSGGLEEIHTIYAISSPIILLVYVFIWIKFEQRFRSRV